MYDYSKYASDDSTTTSGNDSGSSGGDDGQRDMNLTMVPHAAIEGDLVKVFGNQNHVGQSIGLVWENVALVDGCLYHDADKDRYKVFPWKDVVGVSPGEADISADDANQYLMKTYGSTEKRYELVEAVVPGEEPVEIGDAIMWYSGYKDSGPKPASKVLVKMLTTMGRDATVDESDLGNWLVDTSGENLLRPDLQGRRFAFFEVKRQSDRSDRFFHHPIMEDVETGTQVRTVNYDQANSEDAGNVAAPTPAETPQPAADGGAVSGETQETQAVPEPISDFVETCTSLGFTDRDRASVLLNDLVADDGNDLTADMIEAFGGEDAVLDRVEA